MLKSRGVLGGWGGGRGGQPIASGWGRKVQGGNEHKVWGGWNVKGRIPQQGQGECFGLICGIDKVVSFIQLLRLRSVYM